MLNVYYDDRQLNVLIRKLSPTQQVPAIVGGVNRALDRIGTEWQRRILARYRSRTLRARDVRQALIKQKMSATGDRPATLRVRREGLPLARFIPPGQLRRQEGFRKRGGWKKPRGAGKNNSRTPRVRVQVLAATVQRAIKGAFVWEVAPGKYQVFRLENGKMKKLFATSIYTQGLRVLGGLAPWAQASVETEVSRNVNRLLRSGR
jgi:hypothetical protein